MIANSEGKGGTVRRTAGRFTTVMRAVAAGVMLSAALDGGYTAAVAPVRLVGVTAQGDALVIEATEPVAYTVNRPDPVTLVVDMRNVSVADARNDVTRQGTIAGVRFEQATAADGRAVARVHVALTRPAEHAVRSVRNTIRVELTARSSSARATDDKSGSAKATEDTSPAPQPAPTQSAPAPAKSPTPTAPPPSTTAPSAPAKATSASPSKGATTATATPKPADTAVTKVEKGTGGATSLERVESKQTATATTVTLSGNGKLAPTNISESKDRPRRLVIDFPNVGSKAPTQTPIDSSLVTRVRVGLNSSQPLVTRVVMEIASDATYRVERSGESGRDVAVVFEGRVPPGVTTPIESARVTEPEEAVTLSQAIANAAAITPKDDIVAAPKFTPPVPGAPPTTQSPTQSPAQPVDAMSALRNSLITPPASTAKPAESAAGSPTTASPAPARASAPPQTVPALQAPSAAAASTAATAPATTRTPAPSKPQPPPTGAPTLGQAAASSASQSQQQKPEVQAVQRSQRQYTGHTVSLDFEGVDLRAVLRTFSDVSGLNMVIDPDVQGTVDIKLTDVPWDQALDVILRGNQLDYSVDGTIVRISRISTVENENKSRVAAAQAAAERAAQAGGLAFETFPLSYAKAADTAPLLKGSLRLSRYGQVQVDTRTNTLIIADLPEQFPAIRQLLQTLDRAEPQVEIEARIITTTREFARAIGVQWGLNGRMTPELGNTTNLAFPNNGSVGGRLGTQGPAGTDVRANPTQETGTAVNLGVGAASSAIGLALGSINGAFNLDVALSALERTGKGRILSTPRVTTQNNVEAEITQGVQIPVQTEANNTVTVTFKDAALSLKVTPQITAANTVIMQITVENASPGNPVQGIPSIDTQRAITRVQVSDGVTTVMGGIFVQRESTTIDRTPVLNRIPFLGWLFKRDDSTDESRELLIFITPRILKG
jgi:type IV pilus secretin PilQ/predicted competence protein